MLSILDKLRASAVLFCNLSKSLDSVDHYFFYIEENSRLKE